MSWIGEEWKENLTSDVLSRIISMENLLEKLREDIAHFKFKAESLEASEANLKGKLLEKSKEFQKAESEINTLYDKLDKECTRCEELCTKLDRKSVSIHDLNGQLSLLNEKFENLGLKNKENEIILQKRVDYVRENDVKLVIGELDCVEESSNTLSPEEKDETQLPCNDKVLLPPIQESHIDENEELFIQLQDLREQLKAVKRENQILEQKVYENENQLSSDSLKLNPKFDDEEKGSIHSDSTAESVSRNENSEISNKKRGIGEYLGIDVKFYSEVNNGRIEYLKMVEENKLLQKEVENLRKLYKEHAFINNGLKRMESEEHVIRVHPVMFQMNTINDNIDSGLDLHSESLEGISSGLHKQTLTIEDSTKLCLDKRKQESVSPYLEESEITCIMRPNKVCAVNDIGDEQVSKENNPKIRRDDSHCGIFYQHESEELNSYERKVQKLRIENVDTKEEFETYMKRRETKLQERRLETCPLHHDDEVKENILKNSNFLNVLGLNLQTWFEQSKEKYLDISAKLTGLSSNIKSDIVLNKMDQIIEVLSTTSINDSNNKTNMTFSADWSTELDQLKSDLMSSFFSVQDEVFKGHNETQEEIKSSAKFVIDSLLLKGKQTEDAVCDERFTSCRDEQLNISNISTCFDEKCSKIRSHFLSENGINDEIEMIKQKLEDVQHGLANSLNEKHRGYLERKKMQEELVMMIELLKKKDEELGCISCLYEEEKQKVRENDSCFRNEMEDLRREQLEIYEEFRQMCDTLKKRDIELSNRTKQIKLINAEWREKEDALRETITVLQSEKEQIEIEKEELKKNHDEKHAENEVLIKRLTNSEEKLSVIFNNLSRIEEMFLKAKSQGLYK